MILHIAKLVIWRLKQTMPKFEGSQPLNHVELLYNLPRLPWRFPEDLVLKSKVLRETCCHISKPTLAQKMVGAFCALKFSQFHWFHWHLLLILWAATLYKISHAMVRNDW